MNRGINERIVAVMVPVAVERAYSYLAGDLEDLARGDVVEVPLGPRMVLGVVWSADEGCDLPRHKLKRVERRVGAARLPEDLLAFIDWVADYNLAAPGLLLRTVLRVPDALDDPKPDIGIVFKGGEPERLTPARKRVLSVIRDGFARSKRELAQEAGVSPSVIDGLVDHGVLDAVALMPQSPFALPQSGYAQPVLNEDQRKAVDALSGQIEKGGFGVALIDGVTGSGKTEVYFEAAAKVLDQGKQVLVLLPEIALTSQFIARFEQRFGVKPAEWHSGLTPRQRETVWRAAHRGEARVVIAARSALYLPFADLGLIVIDEEHDPAYKQEDVASYHARDMAVKRAHLGGFPIILSSATPSIETRVNADAGRYLRVVLPARFAARPMPDVAAIDMKKAPAPRGCFLSPLLVDAARAALEQGGQVLFFLNRRGYAPLTLCGACGHRFMCPDCSAWLVEHRFRGKLACHHCGFAMPVPKSCPACGEADRLVACGPGVERVAEEAAELFPDARATILSSDLIQGMADMRARFSDIAEGRFDIIVGTQLIAKGHHFPHLALVGVIDGDLGLGNGDLRAAERTFQLLHQVMGRAGRGEIEGKGLIQTHMPDHPVMQALISGNDDAFYQAEIAAREREGLPPFGRLAALIVSARDRVLAHNFARRLAQGAPPADGIRLLGPAEAPIAMVRGRHRFRLLVKTARNVDMQAYLRAVLAAAGAPRGGVRVQVDVDPYNFL